MCELCDHTFLLESAFMKHKCKGREKLDMLRSPVGQAAYSYYQEWMKLQGRRAPKIEVFSQSRSCTTFIKFAQWAVEVRLPNVMGFIRTMVEHNNVSPSLWCRDNVYALYLQGYDNVVSPTQQFVGSIDEVMNLATEFKCAPKAVFAQLGAATLIDMVQKRRISPWFLISSATFRDWWQSLPSGDAGLIENALQVGALMVRISHSEKLKLLLSEFSHATRELDL